MIKNTLQELTNQIKQKLTIFDKVGIASKDALDMAPDKYHPGNILGTYQSVIVFAQGNSNEDAGQMGVFKDYLATVSAQVNAMDLLRANGFEAIMIEGCNGGISLVQMAVAAGLGEQSPVNSLVVEGLGLTSNIAAIVTDAPLVGDKPIDNVCTHCDLCLDVCPIRDIAYADGDLDKCACGKCHNICPV
jgi:epoxyqueuosine reductase QueG